MSDTKYVKFGKKGFGDPTNKYNYWVVEVKGSEGIVSKGKMMGRPWYKVDVKMGKPASFKLEDGTERKYLDTWISSFDLKNEAFQEAMAFCQRMHGNAEALHTGAMQIDWDSGFENAPDAVKAVVTEAAQGTSFSEDDIPF